MAVYSLRKTVLSSQNALHLQMLSTLEGSSNPVTTHSHPYILSLLPSPVQTLDLITNIYFNIYRVLCIQCFKQIISPNFQNNPMTCIGIITIVHMRKLRLRDINYFCSSHIPGKIRDRNPTRQSYSRTRALTSNSILSPLYKIHKTYHILYHCDFTYLSSQLDSEQFKKRDHFYLVHHFIPCRMNNS